VRIGNGAMPIVKGGRIAISSKSSAWTRGWTTAGPAFVFTNTQRDQSKLISR
jgi:hypothetical protein